MIYGIIGGVIVFLALIYFVLAWFVSNSIIHLNRQPVPKTPKDYGMDYEDITFKAPDGINLKGWLIPGNQSKLVILTHVGGLTKYGSSVAYRNMTKLYNKEVQFLNTARHLHDAGYSVLMFDFRNHGESDDAPRNIAGVGLEEYKDVAGALAYIDTRDDLKNLPVAFVSFCMGANSTIIANSKVPGAFKNVKCLFLIQPISMEVFIRSYMKKTFTAPLTRILLPMARKMVVWQGGRPLEEMTPGPYVKDIKVPVKYVQARHDPWTELSDIQTFYNNTSNNPKEFYWIEDTEHRFESYTWFEDKPEIMLDWLKQWL